MILIFNFLNFFLGGGGGWEWGGGGLIDHALLRPQCVVHKEYLMKKKII